MVTKGNVRFEGGTDLWVFIHLRQADLAQGGPALADVLFCWRETGGGSLFHVLVGGGL